MRQKLLRCLSEGQGRVEAYGFVEMTARSVQRYTRKHKDFAKAMARAEELGSRFPAASLEEREELLTSEAVLLGPESAVGSADAPGGELQLVDAEFVETPSIDGTGADRGAEVDPDDPFYGLPELTARSLMALSWRLVLNPKTSAGIHAVHARALHDHFKEEKRHALVRQLKGSGDVARRSAAQGERGLTRAAILEFRRATMGPPEELEEPAAEGLEDHPLDDATPDASSA